MVIFIRESFFVLNPQVFDFKKKISSKFFIFFKGDQHYVLLSKFSLRSFVSAQIWNPSTHSTLSSN